MGFELAIFRMWSRMWLLGILLLATVAPVKALVWAPRTGPTSRAYAAAVSYLNYTYLIGGYSTESYEAVNLVERYDISTNARTELQPLPAARYGHDCAATAPDGVSAGFLYCAGGYRGYNKWGSAAGDLMMMVYNIAENNWAGIPQADVEWVTNACVLFARGAGLTARGTDLGGIFIMGGEAKNTQVASITGKPARGVIATTVVRRWDVALRFWSTVTGCPGARAYWAGTVTGGYLGYLWLIGGLDDTEAPTSSLFRFHELSNTWTVMSPMPSARYSHAASSYQDEALYVTGGLDASGTAVNSVLKYNISTDSWSTLTPLPIAIHSHVGPVTAQGRLWVHGGVTPSSTLLGGQVLEGFIEGTV